MKKERMNTMNEPQIFKNDLFEVAIGTEDGELLFDVETVARSLGIVKTQLSTSGQKYVRWDRVNKYLGDNFSPQVGKGDYISEPMVYKLAFKANNKVAEDFQDWLAVEVLPAIRKNGTYNLPTSPRDQLKLMFSFQEETAERVDKIEDELEDLKENQPISTGDYNFITSRIHQRVREVAKSYDVKNQKQRAELYKDINGGVKKITGVGARSQLRTKHYDLVIEYINDWEPSTATKSIVRQLELELV